MVVEALSLYLLSPTIVVGLNVVENGIDQHAYVWVFVREEFQNYRDHLCLVQNDFAGWTVKEEFEKCIQNLLNHLIIFLFSSQHILQQANQVAVCNHLSCWFIATNSATKHNTLKNYVVFCVAIHQMVVKKFYNILLFHNLQPLVGRDVNHRADQLQQQVSIFTTSLRIV